MEGGIRNCPSSIAHAFEQYYIKLLGTPGVQRTHVKQEIVDRGPRFDAQQAQMLTHHVTDEEIKKAMFSIPGKKAPGPDGFNSTFFKESWHITGPEVCEAVRDFFVHGRMLKEVNCTRLTLIPKVSHPNSVTEFRPIACCNTVYQCITKIICNRLKRVLPGLISPNQSGFVQGRRIVHNVSIIQDLVGMYNRKSSPPGCLLKIDIRKAYDSVQWGFLKEMLESLNFPGKFVSWCRHLHLSSLGTIEQVDD
ncbi:hypothetical protein RDABS01_020551 [Bienertia sinuspersici]